MPGRDFSRRAAGGCRLASDDDAMAYAPEWAVFYLISFARGLRDIIRFARGLRGSATNRNAEKGESAQAKRKGNQICEKFFVENAKIKVLTTGVFVRYNKLNNKKPFFYFEMHRREAACNL